MAFISGPPCPLASRGGGFGQWDPGGDGGCRLLNLRLLWVGRVPPSPLLSPPPPRPHSGLWWKWGGRLAWLAWDCPGKLVFVLVSQESPHSRQKGTVGHPREKNHFLCFPCALPTPWYVILLLPFLQITPFCVCHLFLPRAPAHTPGASRGWSSFQSSSVLELTVTKWVIL